MITRFEVNETNEMIKHENLDVRTITLGISLLDCISGDLATLCENIRKKILSEAENIVPTGKEIESMYGIPIVKSTDCHNGIVHADWRSGVPVPGRLC